MLPLHQEGAGRVWRDRLELLTALIGSPSFDPVYRPDVIRIPRDHAAYPWGCAVGGCERTRNDADLCGVHAAQWRAARDRGTGRAAFRAAAEGLGRAVWQQQAACRVCPQRPAVHTGRQLCLRHDSRWFHQGKTEDAAFAGWLSQQEPFGGYGECRVAVCPHMACSPLGLCPGHEARYRGDDRPGGAVLPQAWSRRFEQRGHQVQVSYRDEPQFRSWCRQERPVTQPGQVNLRGLRPLLQAELRWVLFTHAGQQRHSHWDTGALQNLANLCRARGANSLADLDPERLPQLAGKIVLVMRHYLRLVYFTPPGSREAGFIETDHFGVRFPGRVSHIELTEVSQRWLRDLLWDHLAGALRSPHCPRTGAPFDDARRACIELSAFLQLDAPGGGQDPAVLSAGHAHRFAADQRHRERDGLASLVTKGPGGTPSMVTAGTRCAVFSGVRRLLRDAMDTGVAGRLGLGREFITALPAAGGTPRRGRRRPFPDEVARALAAEANLAALAATHDPADQGMRDIWEAIVFTGRRVNEVMQLRVECTGRYGGLPMLWHDQTKVGNLDAAIRIPECLFQVLEARQARTVDRFAARHGRPPAGAERAALALFPSERRNPGDTIALGYTWFYKRFRPWVDSLDLGHYVPHQARHTLATNLLRGGATLTHIRRYLGHVSDRMAEHYLHLSHSDLEDVLQHVWVAGPGAASPGELLSGPAAPLTAEQALALAVDLSRRSTPAEGGFCTFQPVVDGGACPWKLNCHSCGKFVISGADLLYWRRKREQWYSIAERAPDDATAGYLHQVFAPTAAAIDGLENALAGLGLLEEALALDLRRPQDYFQRIWSLGFRAGDLAAADAAADGDPGGTPADRAGPGDLAGGADVFGDMEETA
ncbi:MAG: tyrosine-type recombinase/integrase [Streptosporangiaceae bacterium]